MIARAAELSSVIVLLVIVTLLLSAFRSVSERLGFLAEGLLLVVIPVECI